MTGAADAVLRIAHRIPPSLIAGAGRDLFAADHPEVLSSARRIVGPARRDNTLTPTRALLRILENAA